MSLKVIVHSASNLPDVDVRGHSDPFVVLSFRGREWETSVQKDTLNPTWPPQDATCEWSLGACQLQLDEKLSIKIKDYEKVWFKKLLGQVEIPLRELRENGKEIKEQSYELEDGKHRPTMGTISLDIAYIPPGGVVDRKESKTEDHDKDEEDDEGDHDDSTDDEKLTGKVDKKRSRRRLARKWSDKTEDFQIRVQIFEGRHLPGSNINPLVRVTVAGQRQQTSIKRSTDRPVYTDEIFAFTFRSSEAELFDELINLEVFNATGPFRSNALLGFYKFDIGSVYERKGHSFIRKWIMLSKPSRNKDKDSADPGIKQGLRGGHSPAGFLKVTAVVQGPGDKLPAGIDVPSMDDKDEDIEANCLIPVGVQRHSASFVLKVYQAKDLPQMDAGIVMKFKSFFASLSLWSKSSEEEDVHAKPDFEEERNLVDPYLIFSFSGNQVSTDIKYNNSNPKFKQVLKIPFEFPSMCERLKLQLMDWDQGNRHDFIGTAYLPLSAISGPGKLGEGFLPQFGPCFVNFYGSPREYHRLTLDKYEDLNKGIGEGGAYRGRVLVELKTVPTHGIRRPVRQAMAKEDEINVESFKKRSKFTLFACFHEATMVAVTDEPVEFEVSIGNKGTKFDETVAPSNTTPLKPVYDHSFYHYLPWGREKPCVWIECLWEDISFRIEPLNILNGMREKLEKDLEDLQKEEKKIRSVLEVFRETCRMELGRFQDDIPKLTGQRNSLDTEIHNLRLTELENLMADSEILSKKPENELKMESVIEEIRNFIKRIRSMAIEPQLSMPDVILWMISGNKRVAYCRVPAHHVLFSKTEAACGKFCGKTIELRLKYPGRDAGKSHHEIPALVRLELWLGPAAHQQQWISRKSGEFNVYAETYENEIRERGKRKQGKPVWKPSSNKNWPHYSDVTGSLKLPTESFTEPEGWKFSGDWIESRGNLTIMRQLEENLTEFLDKIYEHQARTFPGGDWKPDNPRYVDSHGDETTIPTGPPTGWITKTDWSVDLNRAVDDEGWEYSKHRSYWDYGPEEKAFHMSRRRRLIRHRRRDLRVTGKQLVEDPLPTEGWEYAQSLHETFHPEERSKDCLRRRRWLHKIIQSPEPKTESSIKCPVFKVLVKGPKEKKSALCVIPRMLVTYQEPIRCQLWVSIYQARGLIAQDDTGMNDPYVRVAFSNQSQVTETLTQTLCATWDQTLIFREVDIFDNQKDLEQNPPRVVMEIFDYDKRVHDFLGRCIFKPKVRLKGNEGPPEPKLAWHKVRRGDQDGGEILAECELFLIERGRPPALPKPRGRVYPVRPRVAPEKQRKAIEILSWGVRNIKGTNLLLDPNLSVEFECSQTILKSDEVIRDVKRCPNFSRPVLERTILELPKNDEYAPPINIRVFDNNAMFGKSLVGLYEIHSLKEFEVQSESVDSESHEENKTQAKSEQQTLEFETQEVFDWWSKYDASRAEQEKESSSADKKKIQKERKKSGQKEDSMKHIEKYLAKGYDTLTIYPCKLEEVPQFRGFNDFITTFPLRKGKAKSAKDDETEVGQFKGAIRIFNDPDSHDHTMATMHLRSKKPISCVVRVYVIRATQLQPKDPDGLADPYLIISLGDTKVNKKGNHIPKTLNPVFGSTFEFKAKIPLVKDLKIRVMDFDFPDPDDLIGETVIDLEQRLLSGYHATCALPKTYFKSGPFAWRDTLTPFQLLAKHCTLTGKELRLDTGKPEIINIGETPYSLSDFENEASSNQEVGEPLQRLALHVLHKCGLVPEHVETRPLFSKVRPNIEQGKLEMWVDIFSEEDEEFTSSKYDPSKFVEDQTDGRQLFTIIRQSFHVAEEAQEPRDVEKDPKDEELLLKAPVTIDPRKPLKYELRVVIWNTTDVRLEEKSIWGEEMSDIFVKAWIVGIDEEQRTSVHERSLDGNGSFNWRMVFRFEYLPIDKKLVVKEKVHRLSRELRQDTKKPFLKVQIWDKDRFTRSDFIGDLQLDLSTLVRPCVEPSHCGTDRDPREHNQFVDLFIQQWITGWWACYDGLLITGKVQMTMEILSEEEAEENPVGLGQEEPNRYPKLDQPLRPPHSFLWYLAPLKTLRMIIWKNCRRSFFKVLIIFLVILVVFLFVYSVPSYAVKKLMGV